MTFPLFSSAIEMLANAELAPFVFSVVIGVPSAMLYSVELAVIIANFCDFNSAFFVLIIVRGILSLINYVCSFFEQRFGKIGLFLPFYLQLPRFVLALLFFLSHYIFHEENLLNAFLLLNRFTSILFPINYKKLWHYALVPILIVTFVLPFPFTVQILNLNMHIRVQHDNVTFTLDNIERTSNKTPSYSLNAACSALLFAIICLLLNVASLLAFKFGRPQNVGSQQNNLTNAILERKLTIYTVVTFFGQFMMATFMLLVYMSSATQFVDQQNNHYTVAQLLFGLSAEENQLLFLANFNQYPWVNDLSTIVIPAWLLLWASTKMRGIICAAFARRMCQVKNCYVNGRNNNKIATIKVEPMNT